MDEGAAISLLKRAVELDTKKRYTEALVCYKEGLNLLMEVIKGNLIKLIYSEAENSSCISIQS